MKHLLSASMIALGMLAAAPLASAHAATRHPITQTRVVHARTASPRAGNEAYGYAPSRSYRAYPDGARSAYEEALIKTTEDDTY
jgi:hypothetical protein